MLSKAFPRKHISFGKETDFQKKLENQEKIHTIRGNFELWKHNIDKIRNGSFFLSIRQWAGRAYWSKQVEIKEYKDVGYERITMMYNPETGKLKAVIGGKAYENVEEIAKNDGLELNDFIDWFFGQGTGRTFFQGVIIHFTKFRYNNSPAI